MKSVEDYMHQLSTMGGSNSFIVSGKYTKSGKPILASDPHLANQIPSLWYLIEFHAGDYHSIGGSFVGIPGTLVPRSNSTAWGMTNTMADTSDLYLEKIKGEEYFYDGEYRPMGKRVEKIRVLGKGVVEFIVYSTHHGPVFKGVEDWSSMNKISPDMIPVSLENLSLSWTTLHPEDNSLGHRRQIFSAQTGQESVDALRGVYGVTQNVLFAHDNGDFGMTTTGMFPKRQQPNNQGRYVKRGELAENDWLGLLPKQLQPYTLNPHKGFHVSTNNKLTSANAISEIGLGMSGNNRADRLVELIEEKIEEGHKFTVESMKALQYDKVDHSAKEIVGKLVRLVEERRERYLELVELHSEPQLKGILQTYLDSVEKEWSGEMAPNSREGALYLEFMNHFFSAILQKQVPDEFTRRVIMEGYFTNNFKLKFFRGLLQDKEDFFMNEICTYTPPTTLHFGPPTTTHHCVDMVLLLLVQV